MSLHLVPKLTCFARNRLAVSIAALLAAQPSQALVYSWVGSNGSWADMVNWSPNTEYDADGRPIGVLPPPGSGDTAIFASTNAQVITGYVGGYDYVGRLVNSGTLTLSGRVGTLVNSGSLTVGFSLAPDAVQNSGTITFLAGSGYPIHAIVSIDTVLSGGGTVVLNGSGTGFNYGILTNADNTIRGNGTFESLTFKNQGAVRAEGGTIAFNNTNVANTTGTFATAADGRMEFYTSTMTGGTLSGAIYATNLNTFNNITIAPTATLVFGSSHGTTNTLQGTIFNVGTITFAADNTGDVASRYPGQHVFSNNAVLAGGGTVKLNGSGTGFSGYTLTNTDNTIRGNGSFSDLVFINQGAVLAEGGAIAFNSVVFTDTTGTFAAATDGRIEFNGSTLTGGTLTGGSMHATSGNMFDSITIAPSAELVFGTQEGESWNVLQGTITNAGKITFVADNTHNSASSNLDQAIASNNAVLTGGGTVVLNGWETGFSGGTLSNADNTIAGNGTFDGLTFINQGKVRATDGTILFNYVDLRGSSGTFATAIDGQMVFVDSDIAGTLADGVIHAARDNILDNTTIASSATLVIGSVGGSGSANLLQGTIVNAGTITFVADSTDSGGLSHPNQRVLGNHAVLTGGGTVRLNGTGTGFSSDRSLDDAEDFDNILTNADNTIRGKGTFHDITFINHGAVRAEGGTIAFNRTDFTGGDGGRFEAADEGRVVFYDSAIRGTLAGETIYAIDANLFDNTVIASSAMVVLGLQNGSSSNTFQGSIANAGTITFVPDSTDNAYPHQYIVSRDAVLSGGGTVVLNGSGTGFSSATDFDSGTLTNADNTIRGKGRFYNLTLINRGTVTAEGGTVVFDRVNFLNSTGTLNAAPTGRIEINRSTVTGGTLAGGTIHFIDFNTFDNTSIAQSAKLVLGQQNGASSHTFQGRIANAGTITFVADSVANSYLNHSIYSSNVVLSGGGTVVLNGAGTGFNGGALTNTDNTIRGNGRFYNFAFINQGTVRAEGGTVAFDRVNFTGGDGGRFETADDGQVVFNHSSISGTLAGETIYAIDANTFDNMAIASSVTLLLGQNGESWNVFLGEIAHQGMVRIEGGTTWFYGVNLTGNGTLVASAGSNFAQIGGSVSAGLITLKSGSDYQLSSDGRLETTRFLGDWIQEDGVFTASHFDGNYMLAGGMLEIDRLDIRGNLALAGGSLSFAGRSGGVFVSVSGRRSGAFAGLAEGAAIGVGGSTLYLTYFGGDGNDIELVSSLASVASSTVVSGVVFAPGIDGGRGHSEDYGNILNSGLVRVPVVPVAEAESTDASMEVLGSYTQTETGILRMFVAGDTPADSKSGHTGGTYGQLFVHGGAILDGDLQIVLQTELLEGVGNLPQVGDIFDFVISDEGITLADGLEFGIFVTDAGKDLLGGLTFEQYFSGIVADPDELWKVDQTLFSFSLVDGGHILRGTLVAPLPVASVPEPRAYVLMLAGLAALAWVARKRNADRKLLTE